ncbi:MAG: hypothetical protein HYW33_04060 [Candidatus Blackburnbacteria bacterium]|nr:hypothetical protein [Candidatus Blackburnbacteria bacterium]
MSSVGAQILPDLTEVGGTRRSELAWSLRRLAKEVELLMREAKHMEQHHLLKALRTALVAIATGVELDPPPDTLQYTVNIACDLIDRVTSLEPVRKAG